MKIILLLITSFYFSSIVLAQTYWKPEQPVEGRKIHRSEISLSHLYPDPLQDSMPKVTPLIDFSVNIQGPSCENPGFVLEFSEYVATTSQLQDYLNEHYREIMLAVGLLYLEAMYPEIATIIKHINNMAWLRAQLENMKCQGIQDMVRQSGVIPPRRPYANCVEDKIGKGKSRDQAEVDCSEAIKMVHNFLSSVPHGVYNFNLIEESVNWAKRLRDKGDDSIPNDKALNEMARLLGEIEISQDGRSVRKGASMRTFLTNTKSAVKIALDSLVRFCLGQFTEGTKSCTIEDKDYQPYDSELKHLFPKTSATSFLIKADTIQNLARIPIQSTRKQIIEEFALKVALLRGEQYADLWAQIVTGTIKSDGSEDYKPILEASMRELRTQIDALKQEKVNRRELSELELLIVQVAQQTEAERVSEQLDTPKRSRKRLNDAQQ